jgi:LmbE family N-acetylglucosaminyl deacetylase
LPRRIGLVFAHPDDETFCVGGIIAKYAAAGVKIDLFCATDGDAGKAAGIPVSSREELASIRRKETRVAADLLGIDAIEFGGYRDGEVERADQTRLIGDIVAFLRRSRPSVVVGFGPEGAPTGHRDHRAMSRATFAAFFLAPLRSAYADDGLEPHAADRLFFHAWEFPLGHPSLKLESVAPTCSIDVRDFRQLKEAAFKAHATQQGSAQGFYRAALVDVEQLAFGAGAPQPRASITDLFDGLL